MRFQASENQPDSNDKVDCGNEINEMSSPDVEAENETTENNSSQIQNRSSSQESVENIQDNPANTEDQAQAETEITESEKLNSDPEDYSTDRTGTMSPKSFATFKGFLVHPPQMNLPWESMRSVRQCTCGVTFSYSVRKVRK